MSNPRDDHTKLLAETLHDDWVGGPAARFATQAAAHARGRRRAKMAVWAAGSATVLALAVFASLRRPAPTPSETPAVARRAPETTKPGYEIISDDELLTQLRDRPLLALKNNDGTREFVMLPNE